MTLPSIQCGVTGLPYRSPLLLTVGVLALIAGNLYRTQFGLGVPIATILASHRTQRLIRSWSWTLRPFCRSLLTTPGLVVSSSWALPLVLGRGYHYGGSSLLSSYFLHEVFARILSQKHAIIHTLTRCVRSTLSCRVFVSLLSIQCGVKGYRLTVL